MGKKKKKKKIDSAYLIGLIAGIILLLAGIGLFGYTHHKYSGWDEVRVSYQKDECRQRIVKENYNGKVETIKKLYCDYIVSYTYQGKDYSIVEKDVPEEREKGVLDILFDGFNKTRKIDPTNPEHLEDVTTNRLAEIILAGIGLLLLAGSILGIRKRNQPKKNNGSKQSNKNKGPKQPKEKPEEEQPVEDSQPDEEIKDDTEAIEQ